MRRILLLAMFVIPGLGAWAADSGQLADGLYAEFVTPHGVVTAQLFYQQAPLTCTSFVGLAEGSLAPKNGQPFYTGLRWYRVVPDFVIQSGDPTSSIPGHNPTAEDDAAGHPYTFPDEMAPGLHHDSAGVLSIANAGPDTNSSEFFITLRDTPWLDYLHSVFGRVVRGLDLLPQIKPDEAFSIRIIRIGAAAQAFRADEATFKALLATAKKYAGPTEPGPKAWFDDPDKILPQDVPRAQNFNYQLANFARFTGGRIYARVFRKFVPAHPGQKVGGFNHELAEQFAVEPEGVMVSYFADVDTWMIWIGEKWLPRFMDRAGSRDEFVETGALMKRKESFLAGAKQRAAATAARIRAGGRPVSEAGMLKLTMDEVLDGLMRLYETKTTP